MQDKDVCQVLNEHRRKPLAVDSEGGEVEVVTWRKGGKVETPKSVSTRASFSVPPSEGIPKLTQFRGCASAVDSADPPVSEDEVVGSIRGRHKVYLQKRRGQGRREERESKVRFLAVENFDRGQKFCQNERELTLFQMGTETDTITSRAQAANEKKTGMGIGAGKRRERGEKVSSFEVVTAFNLSCVSTHVRGWQLQRWPCWMKKREGR